MNVFRSISAIMSDRVTKGVVDDLTMTYDGNRLSEVDDAADRVTLESSLDYDGRSSEPFAYDASGRLIFYPGTDELSIKYAPNDMPVQMSSETATADYRYLADGRKLSRTLTASLTLSRSIKKRTTTCDVGAFRFTRGGTVGSPKLDRVTLPWGYFDKKLQANVYIKDYQGNIRAVYNQYSTTIVQQTDYYPYGLPKASSNGQEVNPFKYGGKELSSDLSLSYYDFEARMQLPALGIFQRPDPKASTFPWLNTYSYCAGDPINKIDPDGKQPTEYEAALMAQIVYNRDLSSKDLPKVLTDANWELSKFETSIKMEYTEWYENGLQSALFERTTDGVTEYAYVFAGTNSVEDVLEDVAQIIGLSPQYETAIYNGQTLSNELGKNELTFVGHSLGGGEAAAASMATGRPAITFNPAAVSPLTKYINNLGSPSNIVNYRIVPTGDGLIRLGGCFVNNLQDNLHMSAPGKTINIPRPTKNAFSAHSIDQFVDHFSKNQPSK